MKQIIVAVTCLSATMVLNMAGGCVTQDKKSAPDPEAPEPKVVESAYRGWTEVGSQELRFKAKFPGKPTARMVEGPNGNLVTEWKLDEKIGNQVIMYGASAGPTPTPDAVFSRVSLEKLRAMFQTKPGATILKEADYVHKGKLVGYDVEMEFGSGKSKARIRTVVENGMNYGMHVIADKSWDGWSKTDLFMDSFQLLP